MSSTLPLRQEAHSLWQRSAHSLRWHGGVLVSLSLIKCSFHVWPCFCLFYISFCSFSLTFLSLFLSSSSLVLSPKKLSSGTACPTTSQCGSIATAHGTHPYANWAASPKSTKSVCAVAVHSRLLQCTLALNEVILFLKGRSINLRIEAAPHPRIGSWQLWW